MHQNFEVIAGLNYRFRGNLLVHVFSTHKTAIKTTSNDVTSNDVTTTVQGGVVKEFA